MSTIEKLIPIIREHSHQLLILASSPKPTDVMWMEDVGEHLKVLSDIYTGEYRDADVRLEVRRIRPNRFGEVKKQLSKFIERIKK